MNFIQFILLLLISLFNGKHQGVFMEEREWRQQVNKYKFAVCTITLVLLRMWGLIDALTRHCMQNNTISQIPLVMKNR